MQQVIEPLRYRLDAGVRGFLGHGFPQAEFRQGDWKEETVGVRAAKYPNSRVADQPGQAWPRETLPLIHILGMAASEKVQSRHPQNQQASWRQHAGQFPDGLTFLPGWKVRKDIHGRDHVEGASLERQRRQVRL